MSNFPLFTGKGKFIYRFLVFLLLLLSERFLTSNTLTKQINCFNSQSSSFLEQWYEHSESTTALITLKNTMITSMVINAHLVTYGKDAVEWVRETLRKGITFFQHSGYSIVNQSIILLCIWRLSMTFFIIIDIVKICV